MCTVDSGSMKPRQSHKTVWCRRYPPLYLLIINTVDGRQLRCLIITQYSLSNLEVSLSCLFLFFVFVNEAWRSVKRRIEQKNKWFFMYINCLCIPYVFFVDIFTRSFDDFVSMKFLIAVFLPASPFINFADFCQPPRLLHPPCLLFWPKFASLPVYSALPFYLKLESRSNYSQVLELLAPTKEHKYSLFIHL